MSSVDEILEQILTLSVAELVALKRRLGELGLGDETGVREPRRPRRPQHGGSIALVPEPSSGTEGGVVNVTFSSTFTSGSELAEQRSIAS